jgi:hypothetical protein
MNKYSAVINYSNESYYAFVARDQSNGFGGIESVVVSVGKHFKTLAGAERFCRKEIAKRTGA